MNSDRLDGMGSADFLKARDAGPVVLQMPATNGQKVTQPLFTNGPLTIVGECVNDTGKASPNPSSPGSIRTIAEVAASGGLPVWDVIRTDFSVIANPGSGVVALQGQASAITTFGFGSADCSVSAWGFAS